jgi:hypothetical protein
MSISLFCKGEKVAIQVIHLEITDEMSRRLDEVSSSLALTREDVAKVALSQHLMTARKAPWRSILEQFVQQFSPFILSVTQAARESTESKK